ncbi:MAG: hypothetical protein MUO43_00510, partial [Desulfobacterales bacterium]|nr:hypothetical protein [Desulfobacterales bacterium]
MKIKPILIFVLILLFFLTGVSFASHSTITIAEGVAAMGDDKSRNKTESAAMTEAKRNAAEQALTYVRSETKVKNFELEDDIMDDYSKASVKVLEILDS